MERNDMYTKYELEWLTEHYPYDEWDAITSKLGRSKTAIQAKASRLKLRRESSKYCLFSEEEDNLIRSLYDNCDINELEDRIIELVNEQMPYRTPSSIKNRALRIGCCIRKEWTEEEDKFIIDNYFTMSINEMAIVLTNHSRNSIYNRIGYLGLEGGSSYAYTDAETNYIRENYMNMSDDDIGLVLHRNGRSIKEFRRKLGLQKRANAKEIYTFSKFIHRNNTKWKLDSANNCNYRCFITGERFDEIHHLYSKNQIIEEMLKVHPEINIDTDMNTLNKDEQEHYLHCFTESQSKYPLGICLVRSYHKKFHDMYGYGNNTPEQFRDFIKIVAPDKLDELEHKL